MKYQVLKALKTKNKLVKLCDSLKEAHEMIKETGATFMELSYIGQFPTYVNTVKKQVFQIQGQHEGYGFVSGLSKEELSTFNFQN